MSQDVLQQTSVDLAVEVGPLKLKNPVMTASGTAGYGTEYAGLYDPGLLGAIAMKGLTRHPREGNRPARWAPTPGGLLNSVGLQNIGVEAFVVEKAAICAELAEKGCQPIINLACATQEDFIESVEILEEGCPAAAAYEVNVSCPNVKKGGCAIGADQNALASVVRELRSRTTKPLIVKLLPLVTDIVAMAKVVQNEGADGITLVNTIPAMGIDAKTRRPKLGSVTGGLSGPAIKPLALRLVYLTYQATKMPIIGLGGIQTGEDAIEYMLAGASAVAIGCGQFSNPRAPLMVLEEMAAYCEEQGVGSIRELTGGLILE
ncbi:MAG: dihydroorotate dehydrogenase [Sumerlaeia bacterium]